MRYGLSLVLLVSLLPLTGCEADSPPPRRRVVYREEVVPERRVVVEEVQPAPIVEVIPARPYREAVWVRGHWEGRPRHWVWVPGHWR